ncbi:MlaD family protein [Nocardia puris]|uniref:Virulence factor Mce-like protein n=1 Tax=Nocardia puris TaxID=208602 RepID=A0A366DHG6_9NOCA|nr:MCE family protein [Nocardia puris]RBO89436.1 virulence factor Mce-like protein [Nocardia puris]
MIIDPSGRGPSAVRLAVLGVAAATALSAVVAGLGLRYTGAFTDDISVTAVLTGTGDGLPEHADVKFRGLLVGRVDEVGIVAKGERLEVLLALKPEVVSSIPDTVTARVVPANIFGVTAIELVDNGAAPAGLRAGSTVHEDTGEATTQLQTTLTTLRTVLDSIQPERLGRVLATLADALDPAARVPGSTVERLDRWTTEVRAAPGIGDLLGDLGAAAAAVNRSAPELIDVLGESVTAARTITERRAAVIDLLATAGGTVDTVNALFAANPDAGKELVTGLDETFGALAADPDALAVTMANLDDALGRLATVFTWGPNNQMNWSIDVTFTPFRRYTAADCPRYGELSGPRCGGPTVPETEVPQEFPPQLLPRRVEAAGPQGVPAILVPGAIPGLPGALAPPGSPEAPGEIPGAPGMPETPSAPDVPAIPGLPPIPGLPEIPGLTAPVRPAAATGPVRGTEAMTTLLGRRPTTAQWLLLAPVLADGTLTVDAHRTGEAR